MVRRKQHTPEETIDIYKNRFLVLRDRSAGRAELSYEIHGNMGDRINGVAYCDIISCWSDRHTGNAAKVHMKADMTDDSCIKLVMCIVDNGICDGNDGYFTAEKNGTIRFGYSPKYDDSYGGTNEDYNKYEIHNSKASALTAILLAVGSKMPVGGVSLIDLSKVDDSVLLEIGYEKVPDTMRRGPDMWMGSTSDVLRAGGRSGYKQEKENCRSFLALMQESLN